MTEQTSLRGLVSGSLALVALAAFNILAPVGGLPQITAELGRVDLLGWLVTGFLVTSTLATMTAGPVIGEHNDLVLTGLLGLSEEEIVAYAAAGVFS